MTAATYRESRAGLPFLLSVLLLGGVLLSIGGCNTMEGAGEDIEAAGETMSDTSEDVRE